MIATITSLTIHANYQHYRVCQKISRVQKKKPQSLQGSAKGGLLTIIQNCYYFASAAVAVDSSHMTASSSALWSRFSPPSNFGNGHVSTMWFMFCRWPQSREGDWARPHLCKLARHGPWPIRKRFIRDDVWWGRSKAGYWVVGSVTVVWLTIEANDQSSPLHDCVNRCHVWPYWVSRCKPWRWMLKDISIHTPIWMGFDDLKHIVSCHFTT